MRSIGYPLGRIASIARQFSSSSSKGKLLFRQFFEEESSTYTYLLADVAHKDRPAVLIDPVDKTVDRDLHFIKELGLKLLYAMNTHVHADHITGTWLIKKRENGVQSLISKASGGKADILVDAGERIQVGNLILEVRPTPGHTQGCVTYVTGEGDDQPFPRMAFTGDALLIRGCGRTDFQGGDAKQLYRSIHSQIFTLPKDTLLYPGHDYKGQTVTTVEEEMMYNSRLTKDELLDKHIGLATIIEEGQIQYVQFNANHPCSYIEQETFKNIMDNLDMPYPKMFDVAVAANIVCGIHEVP